MNGLDGARTKVPLTTEDLTVDLQKVLDASKRLLIYTQRARSSERDTPSP